ncbi:hypothetical protein QBC46DRAFT_422894 [Diplogelasinospora grovesii]|uniref:Uncharacterized protein n=1 Tax=Diplogelasinospora grovesii TaxID=303347 RepID=A0AAN6MZ12_9PEZI|nr:hypothetical protein QBC46DRAFT_422894 [Diplogelasinospora grovesii]
MTSFLGGFNSLPGAALAPINFKEFTITAQSFAVPPRLAYDPRSWECILVPARPSKQPKHGVRKFRKRVPGLICGLDKLREAERNYFRELQKRWQAWQAELGLGPQKRIVLQADWEQRSQEGVHYDNEKYHEARDGKWLVTQARATVSLAQQQGAAEAKATADLWSKLERKESSFPEISWAPAKRNWLGEPVQPRIAHTLAELQPSNVPVADGPVVATPQSPQRSPRRILTAKSPGSKSPSPKRTTTLQQLAPIRLSPVKLKYAPVKSSPLKKVWTVSGSPEAAINTHLTSVRLNAATPIKTKVRLPEKKITLPKKGPSPPSEDVNMEGTFSVPDWSDSDSSSPPSPPKVTKVSWTPPVVFDQPVPDAPMVPAYEAHRRASIRSARGRSERRSSGVARLIDFESMRREAPSRRRSMSPPRERMTEDDNRRRRTYDFVYPGPQSIKDVFTSSDSAMDDVAPSTSSHNDEQPISPEASEKVSAMDVELDLTSPISNDVTGHEPNVIPSAVELEPTVPISNDVFGYGQETTPSASDNYTFEGMSIDAFPPEIDNVDLSPMKPSFSVPSDASSSPVRNEYDITEEASKSHAQIEIDPTDFGFYLNHSPDGLSTIIEESTIARESRAATPVESATQQAADESVNPCPVTPVKAPAPEPTTPLAASDVPASTECKATDETDELPISFSFCDQTETVLLDTDAESEPDVSDDEHNVTAEVTEQLTQEQKMAEEQQALKEQKDAVAAGSDAAEVAESHVTGVEDSLSARDSSPRVSKTTYRVQADCHEDDDQDTSSVNISATSQEDHAQTIMDPSTVMDQNEASLDEQSPAVTPSRERSVSQPITAVTPPPATPEHATVPAPTKVLDTGNDQDEAGPESPQSQSSGFTPINSRQNSPPNRESPVRHDEQEEADEFDDLVIITHEDVAESVDEELRVTVEDDEAADSDTPTLDQEDETEMLRQFVSRVAADKNARAAAAAASAASLAAKQKKRRSGSTGSITSSTGSPIAKPGATPARRLPLTEKSPNSPSPLKSKKRKLDEVAEDMTKDKGDAAADRSSEKALATMSPKPKRRRKRIDVELETTLEGPAAEPDAAVPASSAEAPRRSTRSTRSVRVSLKSAGQSANSVARTMIPVRLPGMAGNDIDTTNLAMARHQRNEEKDLANVTRANTKKNQGTAVHPRYVLPQQEQAAGGEKSVFDEAQPSIENDSENESEGSGRVSRKDGKAVRWAEPMATYHGGDGGDDSTPDNAGEVKERLVSLSPDPLWYAPAPAPIAVVAAATAAVPAPAAVVAPEAAVEERRAEKKTVAKKKTAAKKPAAKEEVTAVAEPAEPAEPVPLPAPMRRSSRVSKLQAPTPTSQIAKALPAAAAAKPAPPIRKNNTTTKAEAKPAPIRKNTTKVEKKVPATKKTAKTTAKATTTTATKASTTAGKAAATTKTTAAKTAARRTQIASALGLSNNGTPAPKRRGRAATADK